MPIPDFFKLSETKGVSDPCEAALVHGETIRRKGFLRRLYSDFYRILADKTGGCKGKTLVEVGSGGGFARQVIPNLITSDLMRLPNVDIVFSATDIPFRDSSVDAILMLDVLHHIDDAGRFFAEAQRALKAGGKIVMIEPANTLFARFIYSSLHHEPFDPGGEWQTGEGSRIKVPNGALPWIIFSKSRMRFEAEYPLLKVTGLELHTPIAYLASGGLSFRALLPGFCYPVVKLIEMLLHPFRARLAMFQTIVIEKVC